MRFTAVALAATAATAASAEYVTGALGDAPVTNGNPAGVVYSATIESAKVELATFNFTSTANGTGVYVQACFKGINPSEPGPYPYHVHVFEVPADKNCSATGTHLDPYQRTPAPPCDPMYPQSCEVGDLSGKHGKVPVAADSYGAPYCVNYVDPYLSLVETDVAFIGNKRSVVIHNGNATRIGCANITKCSSGHPGTSMTSMTEPAPTEYTTVAPVPTDSYTTAPAPYPTYPADNSTTTAPVPVPTGGAGKIGASGLFLGMVVAVGAMVL